jgi:hypothetical protein
MKPTLGDFDDGPGRASEAQMRVLYRLCPAVTMDGFASWLRDELGVSSLLDVTRSQARVLLDRLNEERMR